MRRVARYLVLFVALSVSTTAGAFVAPAGASALDPGDFQVTTNQGGNGSGSQPAISCTIVSGPGAGTTFDQTTSSGQQVFANNAGATITMQCGFSQSTNESNQAVKGTVVNTRLSLHGTIQMTCDENQQTSASWTQQMTFPTGSGASTMTTSSFTTSVQSSQACTWAMTFTDGSRLAGSIEQVMKSAPTGNVTGNDYVFTVTNLATVHVTGGSGVFADVSGIAHFGGPQTITVPLPGSSGPNGSSGSSGPGGQTSHLFAAHLALSAARSGSGAGSKMTGMHLARTGGTIRIVVPEASVGSKVRLFGLDPNKVTPERLALATAPGARCALTASAKRHSVTLFNTKTASGRLLSTVSSATVRARLHLATGSRARLAATCTLPSHKVVTAVSLVQLAH